MIVLALAQQKGGVGKSTLAINLATIALARGMHPVIIDMDHGQGTVSRWFLRRAARSVTEPQVFKADPSELDGIMKGLQTSDRDLVLIDLPGKSAPTVGNALRHSNLVLIPSRPNDVDIEASLDTVKSCVRMNRRYAYVMNITTPHPTRAEAVANVLRSAKHPVATPSIVQRIAVADAVSTGIGINETGKDSPAAREFSGLLTWILDHVKKETRHEQATAAQH